MPRRRIKYKNKKRLRRGSSGGEEYDDDAHHQPSIASSLEEDLRQQRIRQQERQKLKEKEEQSLERSNTNNEDVGFERPFLTSACYKNAETMTMTMLMLRSIQIPSSSLLLSHVLQTNPMLSIQKRNTLRKLWSTQYHFENMSVNPKAAELFCKKKWAMKYKLPGDSSTQCSWDISCKYRLHPSARTFDVAMLTSDTNTASNTLTQPTIVSIFQDGWGLFHHKLHPDHRINTLKSPPVHAIRMHENSNLCGTIVRSSPSKTSNNYNYDNRKSYLFRWYKLPHATNYIEADLQHPVTDFCFGNEIALFSCPRYTNGNKLNPLFLPLIGHYNDDTNNHITSAVRTINVQNFPQSDALRVEMMCKQQEKIVAFGHRNGQVSILDLRVSGTVCSILQCEETIDTTSATTADTSTTHATSPRLLGSVSDLGFLSDYQSGHQVIVKRSFGSCQLHDLRKSSSMSSSSLSSSSVHHMTVPSNDFNPTLSGNCNGFAVNPNNDDHYQTATMISPYINSNSDACLGIWSLGTGVMVGSRVLQKNTGYNGDDDTLYVEVCQRTTPSFSTATTQKKWDGNSNSNNNNSNSSNENSSSPPPSSSSSSFGVWLKCGAFTRGKINSKVGSLHQISFPGNWKK